jgi:hypothetical protein
MKRVQTNTNTLRRTIVNLRCTVDDYIHVRVCLLCCGDIMEARLPTIYWIITVENRDSRRTESRFSDEGN